MKDFIITCSSTCDLTPFYLRKHNMYYVSFYYYINNERFYDDFFKDHTIDNFYELIKTNTVKTSQPDPEQYENLWKKLISQGYDILHIELSSGISGAVNSALIARDIVKESNPEAKIYVVDSLNASAGYGLLLEKIYDYKKENNDIDKVYEYTENLKKNLFTLFFVENLDQLIKGGRVSKVAGGVGKLLNIVPVMHVSSEGKLETLKKVRGISSAMDEVVSIIGDTGNLNDKVFITNSNCVDNAKEMASRIKNKFPNIILDDSYITSIGTVIGGHTGKGCIAISYIGK